MSDDWYVHGSTEEDREQAKAEGSKKGGSRFFLNAKETRRIIMLDDKEFCVWEHHLKINGRWGNWFTCRKGMRKDNPQPCPLCLSGNKRIWHGYITIIDATGFTGRDGQEVKYTRRLFPMTNKDLEKFIAKRTKQSGLVGTIWDLTRHSADASKIGDDWEYLDRIDPFTEKKFFYKSRLDGKEHPPSAFDYKELFAPLSEAEMQALGYSSGNGDGSGSGGGYQPPDKGGDDDALY
jgi:hypothetical protein